MECQHSDNAPSWNQLQANDTALVTLVYDAAQQFSYDVEWDDDTASWCLEVFCSPSQWRALMNEAEDNRNSVDMDNK